MRSKSDRIDANQSAAPMHERRDIGNRIDGAENVRHMSDRHQSGSVGHQPVEFGQVELQCLPVQLPELYPHARFLEANPGSDIRFVIAHGHDDFIAGVELVRHGACQVLQRDRGRRRKYHFLGPAGVDEFHHRATAVLQGLKCFSGNFVSTAGLYVAIEEELVHPLDHSGQNLCPTRIVEKRPAIFQARKLFAHIGEIETRRRVH